MKAASLINSTQQGYSFVVNTKACDLLLNDLESRFEQKEFMKPILAAEAVLIKSANEDDHLKTLKFPAFNLIFVSTTWKGILVYL